MIWYAPNAPARPSPSSVNRRALDRPGTRARFGPASAPNLSLFLAAEGPGVLKVGCCWWAHCPGAVALKWPTVHAQLHWPSRGKPPFGHAGPKRLDRCPAVLPASPSQQAVRRGREATGPSDARTRDRRIQRGPPALAPRGRPVPTGQREKKRGQRAGIGARGRPPGPPSGRSRGMAPLWSMMGARAGPWRLDAAGTRRAGRFSDRPGFLCCCASRSLHRVRAGRRPRSRCPPNSDPTRQPHITGRATLPPLLRTSTMPEQAAATGNAVSG